MVALVDSGSIYFCYSYFAVFLMMIAEISKNMQILQNIALFVLDNDIEKAYLCNVPDAGGILSRGGAAR